MGAPLTQAVDIFGSLGISVIQNLLYTDFTEKTDLHGFFQAFSVQIQEIRVIRVQNHGKSQRATFLTGTHAAGKKLPGNIFGMRLQFITCPKDANVSSPGSASHLLFKVNPFKQD